MGFEYTTATVAPESISLVPILRSGLGMLDGSSQPLRRVWLKFLDVDAS